MNIESKYYSSVIQISDNWWYNNYSNNSNDNNDNDKFDSVIDNNNNFIW